ncbi:hypothetical protein L210DRAFT_3620159 [Boletus edulis BED1]|uniref:VanZ-like domain-containing protein n=1 Tax=Boletus edulis BED1 TaxID=1328754 RepID=A0AAD4BZP6_BOLED|nr:hypothetical protein L210DRAFT_3620159 [Boletus edulis BED1]
MDTNIQPSSRNVRKLVNKASKAVMKSHRLSLPNYNLPIRLRPWFLLLTISIMLLLAFLGFTNISHSLPLNDKFLHLTCFCIATGVFYFIFDIEEDARRIWFWRHANLIFTAVVCFFFGGFVSEVVQSTLPYKHFDVGDVVANVVGSTIGLYIAYHIDRHYRSRREIARLYRPLNTDDVLDPEGYSDDEAGPSGTQLLPLFNPQSTASAKASLPSKAMTPKADRLSDIWDEREELFGIGDDSECEDGPAARPPSYANRSPHPGPVPMITITRS